MDKNTHKALELLQTAGEWDNAQVLKAIGYALVSIAHTLDLEASRER